MNVGLCTITLRIPGSHSLKDKRRIVRSLCSRVRNRFNAAVAEVGDNESWQLATLGVATVSNDARHASEMVRSVVTYIEDSRLDVEVVDLHVEAISGF